MLNPSALLLAPPEWSCWGGEEAEDEKVVPIAPNMAFEDALDLLRPPLPFPNPCWYSGGKQGKSPPLGLATAVDDEEGIPSPIKVENGVAGDENTE